MSEHSVPFAVRQRVRANETDLRGVVYFFDRSNEKAARVPEDLRAALTGGAA